MPQISDLTGLDNYNLENQNPFSPNTVTVRLIHFEVKKETEFERISPLAHLGVFITPTQTTLSCCPQRQRIRLSSTEVRSYEDKSKLI